MNKSFIKQSAACVVILLLCVQGVRTGKEISEYQKLQDSLVVEDNIIKDAIEDYMETYSYDTKLTKIKITSVKNGVLEAVAETDSGVTFEVCGDLETNKWEVWEANEK